MSCQDCQKNEAEMIWRNERGYSFRLCMSCFVGKEVSR